MTQPLELIHSDVFGKIGTPSLSGGEYFITFTDDYTRHVWVYILKNKSEVFPKFLEWKALVENSSGRRMKTFRMDNGGEYKSAEFEKYLTVEGIKHELTISHTPEQNGVAEQLNRTLVKGVRTVLAGSKLPYRFWAEALSTIVYLRNRSPTKSLEGVTPYEAWNGTKPDVRCLCIFGCSTYAHVPKVERDKLNSKARRCLMLGYGANKKGFRLYDLDQGRVFHSRDVETCFPRIQKERQSSPTYVELEFENEPIVQESVDLNRTTEKVTADDLRDEPNSSCSEPLRKIIMKQAKT